MFFLFHSCSLLMQPDISSAFNESFFHLLAGWRRGIVSKSRRWRNARMLDWWFSNRLSVLGISLPIHTGTFVQFKIARVDLTPHDNWRKTTPENHHISSYLRVCSFFNDLECPGDMKGEQFRAWDVCKTTFPKERNISPRARKRRNKAGKHVGTPPVLHLRPSTVESFVIFFLASGINRNTHILYIYIYT